jgi:hypothetical protein
MSLKTNHLERDVVGSALSRGQKFTGSVPAEGEMTL